ncbi:hypothetical protein J6590_083187 [Homalodisca vitripennis]|nr:hypothetical protein J6590_083187 [Homalodisca vitripennis]
MDLLLLEVLNKIAENRTLYVLAASTTVNQHCNADTAEYVETAECRVEPRFESPESEDSTLTCLYKRAGDNEICLKRIFVGGLKQNTLHLKELKDTSSYAEYL